MDKEKGTAVKSLSYGRYLFETGMWSNEMKMWKHVHNMKDVVWKLVQLE